MNPTQRAVTEEDHQAVAELHAAGHGRNEIARRLQRGGRTISVIAADLGLSFDRAEMTETATRNRTADLAEKRAILAEALTDDALRLTEQMWQPSIIFNFGGKDNTFEKRPVDEPPADAKRALMGAAGMAIDRSLKLVPPSETSAEDEARSMLGKLMVGLRLAYDEAQAGPEEAGGDAP